MELYTVTSLHNLTSHFLSAETDTHLSAHSAYCLLPTRQKIQIRKKLQNAQKRKKKDRYMQFSEYVTDTPTTTLKAVLNSIKS